MIHGPQMTASQSEPVSPFDADVLARAGFPQISHDSLQLGEEFLSDERLVRPQDVQGYAL